MGKYGIGARVRHDGDEGTIQEKRKGERRVRFDCQTGAGPGSWWPKSELKAVSPKVGDSIRWNEPFKASMLTKDKVYKIVGLEHGSFKITDDEQETGNHSWDADDILNCFDVVTDSVEAAGFKVGDKVEVTDTDYHKCEEDGSPFLANGSVGEVATVHSPGCLGVKFYDQADEYDWAFFPDQIEPFTLKAGVAYKTREGKKVKVEPCGSYWHTSDDDVSSNPGHYAADGTSAYLGVHGNAFLGRRKYDIVGYWTEPVAKEPEGPKFKIGDKVRVASTGYAFKQSSVGKEFTITTDEHKLDDEQSWSGIGTHFRWKEFELELIQADTAEPAPLAVGDTVTGKIAAIGQYWVSVDVGYGEPAYRVRVPVSSLTA